MQKQTNMWKQQKEQSNEWNTQVWTESKDEQMSWFSKEQYLTLKQKCLTVFQQTLNNISSFHCITSVTFQIETIIKWKQNIPTDKQNQQLIYVLCYPTNKKFRKYKLFITNCDRRIPIHHTQTNQ